MRTPFLICLAITLLGVGYINAEDYMVTGAGSDEVNGTYEESGTYNGYPQYNLSGTDYYLRYNDWMYDRWEIWDDMMWTTYYYTDEAGSTPPSSGWSEDDGSSPAPDVGPAGIAVSYSSGTVYESSEDDGSLVTSLQITINKFGGETFTGSDGDNFVTDAKVGVNNLPTGISASVIKSDDSTLAVTFSGNATDHDNADDYDSLRFIFTDSAFSGNEADSVRNTTYDISVNFIEVHTVASSGGDYTSITAAVSAADDYDIIRLSGETFTENDITIDKILTIEGRGPDSSVIQAHASKETAGNRIITVGSDLGDTIRFEGITFKNGYLHASDIKGAAISAETEMKLVNCVFIDNVARSTTSVWVRGGAVATTRYIKVSGCLFADNIATNDGSGQTQGGAIHASYGRGVVLENSTFSGNSAIQSGGAVQLSGKLQVINCTMTGNSSGTRGGAISGMSYGDIYNSIIYGNTSPDGGDVYVNNNDGDSYLLNGRNSILGDISNPNATRFFDGDSVDIIRSDPQLGALADNGGPSMTHAVDSTSLAVNAGDDTYAPATDQRGMARKGTSDIGAFEYQPPNTAPVVSTADPDTLSRANEAYSQQVSATDADGDSVMYSLLTAPSGMAISGSGLITWTPDTGHVGTNAVSVQATDDNGGYDTLSYSITVLDPVYAEETVADTGTYLFCGIGVTLHILDLTGTGTITARVYPDSFPPDLPGSNPVKRFFEITRDSSITDITVEVTFTYDQAEFAASDIPDETTLYGARYTGTEWMPYGSTTDTAANTVTLTTTEFSLWSIGGDGGGLPVTLSSFEAEADDGTVVLTWATESEQDNLGFNVWRSADGSGDFDKVNGELIPGAGTVTGHNDYSFDDVPPSSGTWYYRLEQVDNQGQRTIVAATSVDVSGTSGFDGPATADNGRPVVGLHTPARVPAVTVTSGAEQHLSIGLYDAEGAFHGYLFTGALPAGTYEFTGNGTTEPGVYYMYVQGDGWETALKVIIIK